MRRYKKVFLDSNAHTWFCEQFKLYVYFCAFIAHFPAVAPLSPLILLFTDPALHLFRTVFVLAELAFCLAKSFGFQKKVSLFSIRFISLLLSLFMIITCLPFNAMLGLVSELDVQCILACLWLKWRLLVFFSFTIKEDKKPENCKNYSSKLNAMME